MTAHLHAQLEKLERAVVTIVAKAMRFTNVVVITNADDGLVELCARCFLPFVVQSFKSHAIGIVLARTKRKAHFPAAPACLKIATLSDDGDASLPNKEKPNVLVPGGSTTERSAAHALADRLRDSRMKMVTPAERPSIDQLTRKVQSVAQSLPGLTSNASSLDINLVMPAY